MAHRQYEGDGITVHWDSDRCIPSELCILGAPTVFDHDARPWVNLDGVAADDVAKVIDTCPSGALRYIRTDGAPNGVAVAVRTRTQRRRPRRRRNDAAHPHGAAERAAARAGADGDRTR